MLELVVEVFHGVGRASARWSSSFTFRCGCTVRRTTSELGGARAGTAVRKKEREKGRGRASPSRLASEQKVDGRRHRRGQSRSAGITYAYVYARNAPVGTRTMRCGALDARARARCARGQGRCVVARPEVEGDVDVEGLTSALGCGLPPGCDTYEGDMLLADVCRSGLLARRSVSRRDSDTAPPAWATTPLPVRNVRRLGRCLGKGGCSG